MYDGLRQLVRTYQQHGPLFRVGTAGREMLVLAGPMANVFLASGGERVFSNRPLFILLARELGLDDTVVSMDGTPHRHMRGIMKPSFTREAIARTVPYIIAATRRMVSGWHGGAQVQIVEAFRRVITDQLTTSMMHRAAGADFDAVSEFFETLIGCTVSRMLPPVALKSPSYLAAKTRVFALIDGTVAERRATGPRTEPDFIDHLLAGKTDAGEPLDDDVVRATALLPFFGGIDTVAYTCSFMLYKLLKDPVLLGHARAEADAIFAGEQFDAESFKRMRVLHGTTLETLRMYPVISSTARYVTQTFELEGEVVEAGQRVMIATTVAHFLPELWPDPETFDPDRYWEPRNEHRQPGAFAPFSKGPHTCPGAALAEVQITVTLATLLHHARLALDPPTYELEVIRAPFLAPKGGYYVSVLDIRA
jgi:cytochrome P450